MEARPIHHRLALPESARASALREAATLLLAVLVTGCAGGPSSSSSTPSGTESSSESPLAEGAWQFRPLAEPRDGGEAGASRDRPDGTSGAAPTRAGTSTRVSRSAGTRPGTTFDVRDERSSSASAAARSGSLGSTRSRRGALEKVEKVEKVVDRYIERLSSSSVEEADRAYRDVLKAPPGLIPALIAEVENPRPTGFYTLDVLAFHDKVVRRSVEDGRFYYFVKGMGRFAFDDVAAAPTTWRGRKATRLRFHMFSSITPQGRSQKGFPVGVVLRAALLQRMKSRHYPPFDDKDNLIEWWRAYYRLWKASRRR